MMIKCPSIITELIKRGFKAYLVGGVVRDFLLGFQTYDFDIATNALFSDLITLPFEIVGTNEQLGNVVFRIDNVCYEVTTFRVEDDYNDHRHPSKITFSSSLLDDSKRRDFTINSMYYDFENNQIIDVYNGQNDLKNHIIRTVGDANIKFNEDALRILRALRFQSILGFQIEVETENAIYNNYHSLNYLSWERISSEFLKMVMGDYFSNVLMKYSDVFDYLFDGFNIYVTSDVISYIRRCSNKLDVKLAILFRMFPNYKDMINLLSLSKKMKTKIINYINSSHIKCHNHQVALDIIKVIGLDAYDEYITYLKDVNYLGSQIIFLDDVYRLIIDKNITLELNSLKITGKDLINLGYENKYIKEELVNLHNEVIFNKVGNTKEQLLQKAKYHLQKSQRDDIIK